MSVDNTAGGTGETAPSVTDETKTFSQEEVEAATRAAVEAATKRANREAQSERQKRQAWEKLGKTPEELEALLDAQAKLEEEKMKSAGQWDSMRAQLLDKHNKEKKDLEDRAFAADRKYQDYLVKAEATAAIAGARGSTKLLLPIVSQHLRVVDDQVRVVDVRGEPQVDSKGEPLTVSEFVSGLRASEDYGRAFDGSGHSGSGTAPANGGGANPSRIKTKADVVASAKGDKAAERRLRVAFINDHGPDAYGLLPDA